MTTSDRLKQIMHTKDFNLKMFSELTQISYRTLQNYILSGREPNSDALIKLHKHLNVNLNWLLTGKGSMFNPDSFSHSDLLLLKQFNSISEENQKAIHTLLNNLS